MFLGSFATELVSHITAAWFKSKLTSSPSLTHQACLSMMNRHRNHSDWLFSSANQCTRRETASTSSPVTFVTFPLTCVWLEVTSDCISTILSLLVSVMNAGVKLLSSVWVSEKPLNPTGPAVIRVYLYLPTRTPDQYQLLSTEYSLNAAPIIHLRIRQTGSGTSLQEEWSWHQSSSLDFITRSSLRHPSPSQTPPPF